MRCGQYGTRLNRVILQSSITRLQTLSGLPVPFATDIELFVDSGEDLPRGMGHICLEPAQNFGAIGSGLA